MIDFSLISLPFSANDLLSGSFEIIQFLGAFILLYLASELVKPFINLLISAVTGGRRVGIKRQYKENAVFYRGVYRRVRGRA